MDIKHRISVNSKNINFLNSITGLNIEYISNQIPMNGGTLITIIILESNPNWPTVIELIKTQKKFEVYGEGDFFETIFSVEEIRNASWLRLKSTFEQGYPQPKGNWPIKQTSYKIICPKCAIYKQTHPMRLAKEPHLGKKTFMSLIWASEIFCRPIVFHELKTMHAIGYEEWDAIIHKTDKPSEIVRQLYIPEVAKPGLNMVDDLVRNKCPVCGTVKYYPHIKGIMYLKREAIPSNTDFMLTNEWFGFGGLAWREILVSNRIASLILDMGWQGIRFKVVELD